MQNRRAVPTLRGAFIATCLVVGFDFKLGLTDELTVDLTSESFDATPRPH